MDDVGVSTGGQDRDATHGASSSPASTAPSTASATAPSTAGQRERVHVLDDSGELLPVLTTVLTDRGLQVHPVDWDGDSSPQADHGVDVLLVVETPRCTLAAAQRRFPGAETVRVRRGGIRAVRARDAAPADDSPALVVPTLTVGRDASVVVDAWPDHVEPSHALGHLRNALIRGQVGSTRVSQSIYVTRDKTPDTGNSVVDKYAQALRLALEKITYRDTDTSEQRVILRDVARWIQSREGGAREVVELHARVLEEVLVDLPPGARQPLVEEGRLVVLELMGHLVTRYRDEARAAGTAQTP